MTPLLSRLLNSPSARNVHHPACAAAFGYYQKAHLAAGAFLGIGPIKITCCMRQLTMSYCHLVKYNYSSIDMFKVSVIVLYN